MASGKWTAVIDQGTDYVRTMTMYNRVSNVDTAVDLTGCTFSGILKRVDGRAEAITIALAVLDQVTNLGKFTFTLTDIQTDLMFVHTTEEQQIIEPEWTGYVDLTDSGGIKKRKLKVTAIVRAK